jgi:REP element-mobilizing transposase RayT
MYNHRRRSIRLKDYDYASAGAYFVTICIWRKKCLFGEIAGERIILNRTGEIVKAEWLRTAELRPRISLDEFVIMPNHLHGIIITDGTVGAYCNTPLPKQSNQEKAVLKSPSQNIGAIVRGFKAAATKILNTIRQTPGAQLWQRNYYERVIRNEDELNRAREYILNNPLKWDLDEENPEKN